MTTLELPKASFNTFNNDNLFTWWYQPWMETTDSAAKLQRIWLETFNDAMRHEFEFFSTMATSYSKLTHCMLGLGGPQTPASMASCYHEVASDMTEATLKRMRKVSELSDDLRERIWCEI
ncbi:hypothetical protein MHM84_13885 [Halomonas sp. McH1-25]|uniref:hypothetical protein n=1 Tax=unclassified Halomonas TaxID=2609666 RepID=UPI001EF63C66|nr:MULTISPECIES: hypothetical protein [unclassified Halomonas]MCG7600876.1 hypothetical protein [Halomonas sp. McH1-25]MCP1341464.1 hypothetical protein [Halomonas sp. FL8]MCP1360055.1 hypothetical protein [Halomonas sp. BBD45]MCP1364181.1 hypothetical protein [Halomonas sp. BBD48]